jgi:hypothetical protein
VRIAVKKKLTHETGGILDAIELSERVKIIMYNSVSEHPVAFTITYYIYIKQSHATTYLLV